MNVDIAAKLRAPFPAEAVKKLPRVWCKACRDAPRGTVCQQHQKVKCRDCGNSITSGHLHLDYVGHAEATDRLLSVDPSWTWEPVAFGADGLPVIDRAGGLWIRLTVAGVSRLGYGHAEGKTGPDAVKEAIGDAIRNAAMRFGVALDLWGATFKTDQQEPDDPHDNPDDQRRMDIVARGHQRIAEADDRTTLDAFRELVGQMQERGDITAQDAVALRRAIVARLDALYPQAQDATPTLDSAEWPEVTPAGAS